MTVEVDRSLRPCTAPCNVCGAEVTELRRGRCWGCYSRWAESRPVGRGATCTVCYEKRRDQLRLVELHGRSVPLCHACAARIGRLPEIPVGLDAIRRVLRRERRDADRRAGKVDHRIFPRERRVGERRAPPRSDHPDGSPHLALADVEDLIIELDAADRKDAPEQTMVRMKPTR